MRKDSLEKKINDTPVLGKISRMSKEEVYETIIKPTREAMPIFVYLATWRAESMRSNFIFGYNSLN